ncbi:hypothetical protein FJY71_07920, partial [candidate division WOR-3 bacterium]|nr:hypothetical protein [candidate division WOR-3 bacterium]
MLAPVLACLLSTLPETSRVTLYDGPARAEDKVTSMLVDAGGNAYLTGYSFGSGTDFDFCVVKVGSAGETLWTRRYGSPTNCEDRIWASVLDRDGNVVVCGGSILAMEQGWDWLVMKYSPQGESLWLRRLDFAEHGDDRPAGLAIAPDNSIVVTGTIRHRPDTTTKPAARTDWDAATVRFSPAGETLWTRLHDGGTRRDDQGVAVAADSGGNCYVAARTTAGTRGTDVSLLKYAPDGRLVWTRTVDGPARGNDFPTGLVIDRDG